MTYEQRMIDAVREAWLFRQNHHSSDSPRR
jgi:hypothetical protein